MLPDTDPGEITEETSSTFPWVRICCPWATQVSGSSPQADKASQPSDASRNLAGILLLLLFAVPVE